MALVVSHAGSLIRKEVTDISHHQKTASTFPETGENSILMTKSEFSSLSDFH